MFYAFQAKMVMVKQEKLLEPFYQLDHRDPSVVILCRAQLKPDFLMSNLETVCLPLGASGRIVSEAAA